jgi:ribosomal protein L12E/L44/L45/RPP1/RPP2
LKDNPHLEETMDFDQLTRIYTVSFNLKVKQNLKNFLRIFQDASTLKNQYDLNYNDIATSFKRLPSNKNTTSNHSEFRNFLEKVVTQQAKLNPLIKKAQNAGESSSAKAKKSKDDDEENEANANEAKEDDEEQNEEDDDKVRIRKKMRNIIFAL